MEIQLELGVIEFDCKVKHGLTLHAGIPGSQALSQEVLTPDPSDLLTAMFTSCLSRQLRVYDLLLPSLFQTPILPFDITLPTTKEPRE